MGIIRKHKNATQRMENPGIGNRTPTFEERIDKLERTLSLLSLQLKCLKNDLPMVRAIGENSEK